MIIDNDVNAYFIDVNKIANVFNVFDKTNIIQFKIEKAIFYKKIFIKREMLKINIIYRLSRKRVICFNPENSYDFSLIIREIDKITISAATFFIVEFIIFSIIILFVLKFIVIVIIIIIIIIFYSHRYRNYHQYCFNDFYQKINRILF